MAVVRRPLSTSSRHSSLREQLLAERKKLKGAIPSNDRRKLAESRANVVAMFVNEPGWDGWLNQHVTTKCTELWSLLRPVSSPDDTFPVAWAAFFGLFREAVSIALTMHQRVSLFRVDVPPCWRWLVFQSSSKGRSSAGAGPQRLRLAVTPGFETTLGSKSASWPPSPTSSFQPLGKH